MNCLEKKELSKANDKTKIRVLKNGPYLVSGNVPLRKMIIQCDNTSVPSDWLIG